MADTFVADISNYQATANLPLYRQTNAKIISQVNWGTSVTSPNGRIAQIRSLNFAVTMWYMGIVTFADIPSQVNTFSSQLGALRTGEAVCIDWESTNGTMPSAEQRDQAAALIAQAFNIAENMVGVYSTPSFLKNSPPPGWAWVAEYGQPEPTVPHVLWQFTDGVDTSPPYPTINFPGIGYCDGSVYHGTDAQLAAQICPSAPSPTPPPIHTSEGREMIASTSTGNGYVCVKPNGAVYDFGDAKYHGGANLGGNPDHPTKADLSPGDQIIGIALRPNDDGYWLYSASGAVFAYGNAQYRGAPNTQATA